MTTQMDTQTFEQAQEAKKDRAEKIDFKMVTFALAGKEYGVDIMNVKEIAHANRFTYVPNAAPFVRGVYNLRGDIISIIDLRIMFHLPVERRGEDAIESLMILSVGDHVFGVIVDEIDKVVGISRSDIQPPHPIFGDINIKYIQGIVENAGKLYIILDIAKIFTPKAEKEEKSVRYEAPSQTALQGPGFEKPGAADTDIVSNFVKEELFTFRHFAVTAINDEWFRRRYDEWGESRKGADLQLREAGEADVFLQDFLSPYSEKIWGADYLDAVIAALPDLDTKSINVWNPGCGKGYETWSFACALRKKYPDARVKIWANDSDLLNISMAPNMVFNEAETPEPYREYMVKGKNGYSFNQTIRDSIFFEFHDVLNANPLPPVDFILCRDMVSFLAPVDQKRVLDDFEDKLKGTGLLLLGTNERAALSGWKSLGAGAVSAFSKAR